jgi:hypothetical protein
LEEPNFEIYKVLGLWETNLVVLVIVLVVLLAAYLAAAYRAGPYLRRSQVFIITGLMLWFSYLIIAHIHSALQVMIDMREQAFFGYMTLRKAAVFKWLVTMGCSLAPLACIRFMLHMRHPRRADNPSLPPGSRRSSDQPSSNHNSAG